MTPTMPTIAIHEMRFSVRMLESVNTRTNATAAKMAVQAPWSERALREIDKLSIAEPVASTYSTTTVSRATPAR